MKVLLAQTNLKNITEKTSHPHAGLASLGAYSLNKGHLTFAIDAKYNGITNDELLRKILQIKPDIIGFTVRTPDVKETERLSVALKERIPNTKIIVGGAHVTGLQERVLVECRYFDIGVYGEGEVTFSELLDTFGNKKNNIHQIKGIIYRNYGKIYKTESRPFIANLDSLLFPAWNLFPSSTNLSLFTSRGCPFKCIFCQRVMGSKVRKMTPERVIKEIEWSIKKYNAVFLQIEDEVFGINRKWQNEVLDIMIKKGINKQIKWFANSRVNIADLDQYEKMKKAGCIGLGFGIESGNQNILNIIDKGFSLKQAINAIDLAKRVGLITYAFFILGHPNETKKTIRDTIDFACRLNPTEPSFGMMIPYPGTKIYEMAKNGQGGYKSFHEDWEKYTKYFGKGIELEGLSYRTLKRYQRQAYIEFYLRNFRIKDFYGFIKKYIKKSK